MNDKPSFYAIIPANVRYDKNISPNAKLLYGEITALCNKDGFCWTSNDWFSDLYEVSIETVSRWISSLKREGYIRVEVNRLQGNKRRIYLLTKTSIPIDKKVNTLLTKTSIPIDKKVNSYIRNNNTINNTRENSARATDFLKENYAIRYEQEFLMKYQNQIKDFVKFCEDFNDTCDTEELKFTDRILLGRIKKYARNWIQNQNKFQQAQEQSVEQLIGKRLT